MKRGMWGVKTTRFEAWRRRSTGKNHLTGVRTEPKPGEGKNFLGSFLKKLQSSSPKDLDQTDGTGANPRPIRVNQSSIRSRFASCGRWRLPVPWPLRRETTEPAASRCVVSRETSKQFPKDLDSNRWHRSPIRAQSESTNPRFDLGSPPVESGACRSCGRFGSFRRIRIQADGTGANPRPIRVHQSSVESRSASCETQPIGRISFLCPRVLQRNRPVE